MIIEYVLRHVISFFWPQEGSQTYGGGDDIARIASFESKVFSQEEVEEAKSFL